MRKAIICIAIGLFPITTLAANSIIGKRIDKTELDSYQYEFKKNSDFEFTRSWVFQGKRKINVTKGVWEVGSWNITFEDKEPRPCNLTIYAGSNHCCHQYKFIANNLILTREYGSGDICSNRVLIKGDIQKYISKSIQEEMATKLANDPTFDPVNETIKDTFR